jgi:hypothetical protein
MRKELSDFAESMEKELARHDKTKGSSWKTMFVEELEGILPTNIEEWQETLQGESAKDTYIGIANLCMMLWYRENNNANS